MITVRIKENSKQAKMFAEYAKTLPYVEILDTVDFIKPTTKKEVVLTFLRKVKRSANHAREIAAGTRKGIPLKDFLDELY